jgi:signal transduction histidine kinase
MNRSLVASALVALAMLCGAGLASAQSPGTAAEAKAMINRAIAALKANQATALAEFNDKNDKQFHERDLYVFCFNMSDGKFTAHTNPALIGTDVRALKDPKGDPLGQRGYDLVKDNPEGDIGINDYNFPKPGTTEFVPKEAYMTRIGNEGCGVGYYK